MGLWPPLNPSSLRQWLGGRITLAKFRSIPSIHAQKMYYEYEKKECHSKFRIQLHSNHQANTLHLSHIHKAHDIASHWNWNCDSPKFNHDLILLVIQLTCMTFEIFFFFLLFLKTHHFYFLQSFFCFFLVFSLVFKGINDITKL